MSSAYRIYSRSSYSRDHDRALTSRPSPHTTGRFSRAILRDGRACLEANGITVKVLFLARDKTLTPGVEPLKRIQRRLAIWAFVAIQFIGIGATFAITQTIAAVGFPVIILLPIPVRTYVLPKWFTEEELSLLDAPTASPFTMISVGGNFGQSTGELDPVATGEQTVVQSGSASVNEGLFIQREESDSEEVRAERGEGLAWT